MPEKRLEKQYQNYGRDVLSALMDAPSGSGYAAGAYLPYVRFQMDFPTAVEAPQLAGKFTDMVRGKITAEELYRGNEIHDMAHAISHAVEYAINDGTQQFTVETVVDPIREGAGGTSVSFFIYSESHHTPEELQHYLDENRQSIMARYAGLCGGPSGRAA